MLWKKIEKFWRTGLANIKLLRVCSVIVIIFLLCVAGCSNEENSDSPSSMDSDNGFMADIGSIKFPENVEEMRIAIRKLGKKGYAAVDSENQIDMTEEEQVIHFCNQVENGKSAEVTILVISYDGGITKYHLKTEGGKVDVDRRYYQYQNESLQCTSQEEYPAYSWVYTDDGYLFLHDWNEDDYSDIDFYDMFDILYPLVYGKEMPYTSEEIDAEGRVYRIPAEEFEKVILSYFNISIETLRSRITYFPEENAYEYRPLEDGGVQYVSNRLLPSEAVYEMPWHANRLTKEQWQEYYENN